MDKRLVFPGDKIADGRLLVPNTYNDGKDTYAAVVGMLDEEGRYIALVNRYRPAVGDVVVGIVGDVRHAGYSVEMGLPQKAMIPSRTMRTSLQLGDFVICKVKTVSEVGDVDLGEVRRLPRGKVVEFPSAKIPRLIGRKSSMLTLIQEHVGGDIMVGNNGLVWISDRSDMPLALKAIKLIERKAHKSGLTDEVASLLRAEAKERAPSQMGGSGDYPEEEAPAEEDNQGEDYGRND